MNIIKYKPRNTSLLEWDFPRIIDNFFNDGLLSNDFWGFENGHYPKVDVKEEEGRYVVEADLPGISEKDLEVKVEDNLLTISSKKDEEKKDKKKGYLVKERRSYSFTRSFVLPGDVDKDKIEARFKNGVLTLTVDKNPAALPKQIEIKAE